MSVASAAPSVGQRRALRLAEGALGLAVALALVVAAGRDAGTHAMTVLLGTGQLVLGLMELSAAMRAAPGARGRIGLFVGATVSTVSGAFVLGYGGSTVDRLRVAMAIWFALIALLDLATARQDRPRGQHLGAGVVGLALAAVLVVGAWGLPALTWLLACAFAVRGGHELVLARRQPRYDRPGSD